MAGCWFPSFFSRGLPLPPTIQRTLPWKRPPPFRQEVGEHFPCNVGLVTSFGNAGTLDMTFPSLLCSSFSAKRLVFFLSYRTRPFLCGPSLLSNWRLIGPSVPCPHFLFRSYCRNSHLADPDNLNLPHLVWNLFHVGICSFLSPARPLSPLFFFCFFFFFFFSLSPSTSRQVVLALIFPLALNLFFPPRFLDLQFSPIMNPLPFHNLIFIFE